MSKKCLFIIDPQKDFMPGGALGIPGADKDMERLSLFIESNLDEIDMIFVTLDSHHKVDISHPIWWMDKDGNHPSSETPTPMSKEDVVGVNAKWFATDPQLQGFSETYLKNLETKGASHTVWPPHCLIGSVGHTIEDRLFEALSMWEEGLRVVQFIQKGVCPYTEHFGAFEAEIPITEYEDTAFNHELLATLLEYDKIIVAGEASTHCVAKTVSQMIEYMSISDAQKLIYLEDACSPVPTMEDMEASFKQVITTVGVTVTNTRDLVL